MTMEMSWLALLGLSVGLATDAFAVAVAAGLILDTVTPRHVFRLGFHFGLFQFMMPILGWLAGSQIAGPLDGYDHLVAAALLAFVGIRMVRSGLQLEGQASWMDPSRGRTLVMLSIATSIDALAVGFGLAMLEINILYPSLIIGVVTGSLSLLGLGIGRRLSNVFGKRMEVVGGLVLVALAFKILLGG